MSKQARPGQLAISPRLFAFLHQLRENNNRAWFAANRDRYLEDVQRPAIGLIVTFAPHLRKISSHMVADPRRVGGSLFRIYRDTRFSADKTLYKTYVGIQFRHEKTKEVCAPGFYVHLEPGKSMVAAGIWHPESAALGKVRDALVTQPNRWLEVTNAEPFRRIFRLRALPSSVRRSATNPAIPSSKTSYARTSSSSPTSLTARYGRRASSKNSPASAERGGPSSTF